MRKTALIVTTTLSLALGAYSWVAPMDDPTPPPAPVPDCIVLANGSCGNMDYNCRQKGTGASCTVAPNPLPPNWPPDNWKDPNGDGCGCQW